MWFAQLRARVLCAALLAALASPACAQSSGHEVGTGQSMPFTDQPASMTPSNLPYGYRLPTPEVDENAPASVFLQAARRALAAGRGGEAQEALERAESRALDRSVRPSRLGQPSRQPVVADISAARAALAAGDRMRVLELIDAALKAEAAEDAEAR